MVSPTPPRGFQTRFFTPAPQTTSAQTLPLMSNNDLYALVLNSAEATGAYVPSLTLVVQKMGWQHFVLGDAVVLAHARGLPMSCYLLQRMCVYQTAGAVV
jgi:hypothetical protein